MCVQIYNKINRAEHKSTAMIQTRDVVEKRLYNCNQQLQIDDASSLLKIIDNRFTNARQPNQWLHDKNNNATLLQDSFVQQPMYLPQDILNWKIEVLHQLSLKECFNDTLHYSPLTSLATIPEIQVTHNMNSPTTEENHGCIETYCSALPQDPIYSVAYGSKSDSSSPAGQNLPSNESQQGEFQFSPQCDTNLLEHQHSGYHLSPSPSTMPPTSIIPSFSYMVNPSDYAALNVEQSYHKKGQTEENTAHMEELHVIADLLNSQMSLVEGQDEYNNTVPHHSEISMNSQVNYNDNSMPNFIPGVQQPSQLASYQTQESMSTDFPFVDQQFFAPGMELQRHQQKIEPLVSLSYPSISHDTSIIIPTSSMDIEHGAPNNLFPKIATKSSNDKEVSDNSSSSSSKDMNSKKVFWCPICLKENGEYHSVSRKRDLGRHIKAIHDKNKQRFFCGFFTEDFKCKKSYSREDTLKRHQRVCHHQ
ncbi:hypothetical protein BDA99DRAFT_555964 [Phascolomyces articulosus]|uniref:C2H2-type domain-containing protein n=1 Tax=Phascolomyces articulosus TaxID=60185 RepID=A0AAD5K8Q3_9FUNG|nr:hypothetical protein BDA99DRAFT_555964 [Phascolomyces articulosus]